MADFNGMEMFSEFMKLPGGEKTPESLGFLFEKEAVTYTPERAEMDINLFGKVDDNSEISRDELLDTLKSDQPNFFASKENSEFIGDRLDKVIERRNAVKGVFEKYETPEKLYEGLFGQLPKGEVQFVGGPLSIDFVCFDKGDFDYVLEGSYAKGNPPTVREEAGGVIVNNCKEAELKSAVTCIKSQDLLAGIPNTEFHLSGTEDVIQHERQHVINKLILDEKTKKLMDEFKSPDEFFNNTAELSEGEFMKQCKEYLITFREMALELIAKDELSAYLKEGLTVDKVNEKLSTGFYGNSKYWEEFVSRAIPESFSPERKENIEFINRIVFRKYDSAVLELLESAQSLEKLGYERNKLAMITANVHARQLIQSDNLA
jgi:hypothetical protein